MGSFSHLFDTAASEPNKWELYFLGQLAQIAYDTSDSYLRIWAQAMDVPNYAVHLTPSAVCPNFHVVGTDRRLIVAIPGTTSTRQMVNNIAYSGQRINTDFAAEPVHSFFLWCAEEIVNHVKDNLDLFASLQEVIFVGHSLGGAVAQLLADWVQAHRPGMVKMCVTFNTPRVGSPAWAQRPRFYDTWLTYNTRDVVCELPLAVSPGLEGATIVTPTVEQYEHRSTLIPVESVIGFSPLRIFDLGYGFFSAATRSNPLSNISLGVAHFGTLTNLVESGGFAPLAAGTILTSLPVAVSEHRMEQMLTRLREESRAAPGPEDVYLEQLYQGLVNGAILVVPPVTHGGFLAPPTYFLEGQVPPHGVPPIPPVSVYIQAVDAAISWEDAPSIPEGPPLADANWRVFADGLTRAVAPAVTSTPAYIAATAVPPRPNWLFNGKDRRLLQKLWELIDAIDRRDLVAIFAGPSAALSTRDAIIDDNSQDAWQIIRDHVATQLGLYYAPTS